jgi:hypothetical protein
LAPRDWVLPVSSSLFFRSREKENTMVDLYSTVFEFCA